MDKQAIFDVLYGMRLAPRHQLEEAAAMLAALSGKEKGEACKQGCKTVPVEAIGWVRSEVAKLLLRGVRWGDVKISPRRDDEDKLDFPLYAAPAPADVQKDASLLKAIEICEAERLEATGHPEDHAYNLAITHCTTALRAAIAAEAKKEG